jgi:hypothetical protein
MGTIVTPPGRTTPARGRSRELWGRLACGRPGVCVLVALLLVPAVVRAQPMRWPEAVAALAAERERALFCGRELKRYAADKAAVLSRGERTYVDAKAEMDGVIRGLIVVLAEGGTPPDLADLEARLTRGFQARDALCRQAIALVPEDPGTRNVLVQVLGIVLTPLLEAVRALYTVKTEQDRLLRQTIQTQLEATLWADFADITP